MHVTLCPPAPQNPALRFDKHQFYKWSARPVDGKNGIGYEDYARMGQRVHTPSNERRMPTPEWALDDAKLRLLLVRFFENRAGITLAVPGTLKHRLDYAWRVLKDQKSRWEQTINRLQARYYNLRPDEHQERRQLEIQIENCDSCLLLLEKGPGAVLRMVYLYYRAKQDSVGTALAIGCKPPVVRTTLFRMDHFHKKISGGAAELPQATRPAGKAVDLTGRKVGRLTVLGRHVQNDSSGGPRWLCQCECGGTRIVCGAHLTCGSTRSCGCLLIEANKLNGERLKVKGNPAKDITGQRFGRLVAIKPSNLRTKAHDVLWFCKCDCGREKLVSVASLNDKGGTRSCGCARIENMKKVSAARGAKARARRLQRGVLLNAGSCPTPLAPAGRAK